MAVLRVGVLISGRGSNLLSLIQGCASPDFPAQIVCVISNKADAKGLAHAHAAGIAAHIIDNRDFTSREAFESALDSKLNEHQVQLVCQAGFMRILTSWFVGRWLDRLINIHPSLLPSFPGLHTHKAVLDYGAKLTGCTIHFVRTELDCGPIIMQAVVAVLPDDDEDTLSARVLEVEHRAYPAVLGMIAENRVSVINDKVFISEASAKGEPFFNPTP